MFGLILGSVVILLLGARSLRGIATRMLIILVPALLVVVFVKAPTNDDMLEHGGDERVDAVLSHTARGTLRPTEEGSLKERLTNWTRVATEIIPNRPLGMGLGATSLGAYRYNAENMDLPPIDSHLISTAISCGVPTLVLLLIILGRATLISWRSYRGARGDSNESATWRTALAIMSILFLNNMFGNTLTLYSVAPICWLLVGWISTHGTNQQPAPTREVIEM